MTLYRSDEKQRFGDGMYNKTNPEVVEELRKYFNQNENQPQRG